MDSGLLGSLRFLRKNIQPYSDFFVSSLLGTSILRACSIWSILQRIEAAINYGLCTMQAVGEEREWSGTRERVWPSSPPGLRTGRAGFHTNLLNRVNYMDSCQPKVYLLFPLMQPMTSLYIHMYAQWALSAGIIFICVEKLSTQLLSSFQFIGSGLRVSLIAIQSHL